MSVVIKCLYVSFEKLDDFKPFVDFYRFGNLIGVYLEEVENLNELKVQLNPEKAYDVSLDQSTTCTGIFIRAHDNSEIVMMEVKNKHSAGFSAEDYMFILEKVIHKMCENQNILTMIYEQPIETKSFRSSQVLFQLEGMIRMLCKRYSEFEHTQLETIESGSWKKAALGTAKGTKLFSKEKIGELFPFTRNYIMSLNKDQDVYEAVGIMMGFYMESYDSLGRRYVRGKNYTGNIGCLMLDVEYQTLANALKEEGINTNAFVFNPKYSTVQNIEKAVGNECCAVVQFEDPHLILLLQIESNLKLELKNFVTLLCVPSSKMTKKIKQLCESGFNFYI